MKRRRPLSSLFVVAVVTVVGMFSPSTAHAYYYGISWGCCRIPPNPIVGSLSAAGFLAFALADLHLLSTGERYELGYSLVHMTTGLSYLGVAAVGAENQGLQDSQFSPALVAALAIQGGILVTIPIVEWAFRGTEPSAVSLRLTPGGASLGGAF